MTWRAKCPGCGRSRWVSDDEAGGGPVLCPACGTRFDAPRPGTHAAPPPPAAPVADTVAPPPPAEPPPRSAVPWLIAAAVAFVAGILLTVAAVVAWQGWHRPAAPRHAGRTAPVLVAAPAATRPTSATSSRPTAHPTRPRPASPRTRPVTTRPVTTRPVTVPPATAPAPVPAETFHPVHSSVPADDLDDRIGRAITRGLDALLAQFDADGLLTRPAAAAADDGQGGGADALAVYALLQAARATDDPRLLPNTPLTDELLRSLKALHMNAGRSTYARSLRAQALGVYARPADRQALRADAEWLIASAHEGAYTYDPLPKPVFDPIPGRGRPTLGNGWWDNSNSQYGAYGVWAAQEAGEEVPNHYWDAVHKHWVACQLHDGQWGYTAGNNGRPSMTVAGLTSLLVAEDQLDLRSVVDTVGRAPYTPAVARGLAWLESGTNSVDLSNDSWRTYSLYGLERAALASGYKRFGTHDWYRELAVEALTRQQPDGSWSNGSGTVVDTSFTLLFLARGRHPIFMNKLRYDGGWANRPRDVSNLTRYAGRTLERSLNWQVVDVRNGWLDWTDAPVLFVSGHAAWAPTPEQADDLRAYADNGGLIFTHADGGAAAFTDAVVGLAHRLYPDYPMIDVPATDPIYSTVFPLKPPLPPLRGVTNGSRWLLVHSPADLNKPWQLHDWQNRPVPFQLGLNLFVYAAGKGQLLHRLQSTVVAADPPGVTAVATVRVARVKYAGNFDPEPAALPRVARLLLADTGVRVEPVPTDPAALSAAEMPVAFLTGTAAVHFSDADVAAIRAYVAGGGVLLIDPCGGSPAFLNSVQADLLPRAFPHDPPRPLPVDHPIHDGSGEGMSPLTDRLRPGAAERLSMASAPLQYVAAGSGLVLLSPVDVTTALLGTSTWGVNGYTPAAAYALVRNTVLFDLERAAAAPATRPTTVPTPLPDPP